MLLRFSAFARFLAQINMIPDSVGTLRWEMLAVKFQDKYYVPIGLQTVRIYRGLENDDMVLDFAGSVHLGKTRESTLLTSELSATWTWETGGRGQKR